MKFKLVRERLRAVINGSKEKLENFLKTNKAKIGGGIAAAAIASTLGGVPTNALAQENGADNLPNQDVATNVVSNEAETPASVETVEPTEAQVQMVENAVNDYFEQEAAPQEVVVEASELEQEAAPEEVVVEVSEPEQEVASQEVVVEASEPEQEVASQEVVVEASEPEQEVASQEVVTETKGETEQTQYTSFVNDGEVNVVGNVEEEQLPDLADAMIQQYGDDVDVRVTDGELEVGQNELYDENNEPTGVTLEVAENGDVTVNGDNVTDINTLDENFNVVTPANNQAEENNRQGVRLDVDDVRAYVDKDGVVHFLIGQGGASVEQTKAERDKFLAAHPEYAKANFVYQVMPDNGDEIDVTDMKLVYSTDSEQLQKNEREKTDPNAEVDDKPVHKDPDPTPTPKPDPTPTPKPDPTPTPKPDPTPTPKPDPTPTPTNPIPTPTTPTQPVTPSTPVQPVTPSTPVQPVVQNVPRTGDESKANLQNNLIASLTAAAVAGGAFILMKKRMGGAMLLAVEDPEAYEVYKNGISNGKAI